MCDVVEFNVIHKKTGASFDLTSDIEAIVALKTVVKNKLKGLSAQLIASGGNEFLLKSKSTCLPGVFEAQVSFLDGCEFAFVDENDDVVVLRILRPKHDAAATHEVSLASNEGCEPSIATQPPTESANVVLGDLDLHRLSPGVNDTAEPTSSSSCTTECVASVSNTPAALCGSSHGKQELCSSVSSAATVTASQQSKGTHADSNLSNLILCSGDKSLSSNVQEALPSANHIDYHNDGAVSSVDQSQATNDVLLTEQPSLTTTSIPVLEPTKDVPLVSEENVSSSEFNETKQPENEPPVLNSTTPEKELPEFVRSVSSSSCSSEHNNLVINADVEINACVADMAAEEDITIDNYLIDTIMSNNVGTPGDDDIDDFMAELGLFTGTRSPCCDLPAFNTTTETLTAPSSFNFSLLNDPVNIPISKAFLFGDCPKEELPVASVSQANPILAVDMIMEHDHFNGFRQDKIHRKKKKLKSDHHANKSFKRKLSKDGSKDTTSNNASHSSFKSSELSANVTRKKREEKLTVEAERESLELLCLFLQKFLLAAVPTLPCTPVKNELSTEPKYDVSTPLSSDHSPDMTASSCGSDTEEASVKSEKSSTASATSCLVEGIKKIKRRVYRKEKECTTMQDSLQQVRTERDAIQSLVIALERLMLKHSVQERFERGNNNAAENNASSAEPPLAKDQAKINPVSSTNGESGSLSSTLAICDSTLINNSNNSDTNLSIAPIGGIAGETSSANKDPKPTKKDMIAEREKCVRSLEMRKELVEKALRKEKSKADQRESLATVVKQELETEQRQAQKLQKILIDRLEQQQKVSVLETLSTSPVVTPSPTPNPTFDPVKDMQLQTLRRKLEQLEKKTAENSKQMMELKRAKDHLTTESIKLKMDYARKSKDIATVLQPTPVVQQTSSADQRLEETNEMLTLRTQLLTMRKEKQELAEALRQERRRVGYGKGPREGQPKPEDLRRARIQLENVRAENKQWLSRLARVEAKYGRKSKEPDRSDPDSGTVPHLSDQKEKRHLSEKKEQRRDRSEDGKQTFKEHPSTSIDDAKKDSVVAASETCFTTGFFSDPFENKRDPRARKRSTAPPTDDNAETNPEKGEKKEADPDTELDLKKDHSFVKLVLKSTQLQCEVNKLKEEIEAKSTEFEKVQQQLTVKELRRAENETMKDLWTSNEKLSKQLSKVKAEILELKKLPIPSSDAAIASAVVNTQDKAIEVIDLQTELNNCCNAAESLREENRQLELAVQCYEQVAVQNDNMIRELQTENEQLRILVNNSERFKVQVQELISVHNRSKAGMEAENAELRARVQQYAEAAGNQKYFNLI